jgi:hypothetical protein
MTVVKFPAADIEAKQAKAYFDMEPHICDVVKMGTIAAQLFDDPDRELYDFAVHPPFGNAGRAQSALLRDGLPAMKRRRRSIRKRNRQRLAAHARRMKR